jgi:2,4-diaminopentanoate dehydrogenase
MTGFGGRIDSIRVQQLFDWTTYPNKAMLTEMMGFGKPVEDGVPPMATPGAATATYGGNLKLLAKALGVEVEAIRETHDRRATERAYDTGIGRVGKGTNGALRHELVGIVDGEPKIVLEGVSRVHPEVAPDWPSSAMGSAYRLIIKGNPNITSEVSMLGEDGDPNSGACLATGMRAVHCIPAVCAAPPGILEPWDLPIVTGRGSLQASSGVARH